MSTGSTIDTSGMTDQQRLAALAYSAAAARLVAAAAELKRAESHAARMRADSRAAVLAEIGARTKLETALGRSLTPAEQTGAEPIRVQP